MVSLIRRHLALVVVLFLGVLLPLIAFGKLGEIVWRGGGFPWDGPGLRLVHRGATPGIDRLVVLATSAGALLALPAVGMIALGLRLLRKPEAAVFFLLALGGAAGLNLLTKACFRRKRPDLWASPLPEYDYSFPSGHAMLSMTVFLVLLLLAWPTRLRWPALLLGLPCVACIGWTRLYLGVHYPSDVLAGWSAALLWVVGVYLILSRHAGKGSA